MIKKTVLAVFLSTLIGLHSFVAVMAELEDEFAIEEIVEEEFEAAEPSEEIVPDEQIAEDDAFEDVTSESEEILLEESDLIAEEEPLLEESVSDSEDPDMLEESFEDQETEAYEEDVLSVVPEEEDFFIPQAEPEETETALSEEEITDELGSEEIPQTGGILANGDCGDDILWALNDDGSLIISGTGDMWDWINLESVPWDAYREKINKIDFKKSITSIGGWAFKNCKNLTSVTLPGSLTSIGAGAFSNSGLTSLVIPDSVKSIDYYAFDDCSKLKTVVLSGNVEVLKSYTFTDCIALEKVTILYGVKKIEGAFHGCKSLTSVTIPNSVTEMNYGSFSYCSSLQSITIPDSVTSIGDSSFYSCTSLSKAKIGKKVSLIGEYAFKNCSISEVTLPASLKTIDDDAFSGCTKLKKIRFLGNAPTFTPGVWQDELGLDNYYESRAFLNVTATAYYPYGDSTWTKNIMKDYGGTITWKPWIGQPKLVAAYNGAKGIGIKFVKEVNATEYVIYRKFNGSWSSLRTISAKSSELQASGNTLMYTDTSVASNYGKGYVYSVAAKDGSTVTTYDTKGCAIYRLKPPTLTKAVNSAAGTAIVYWSGVFGKTETNGHYDLQYAEYVNGKAGTFKSVIKLPGYKYNVLKADVKGLKKGKTYVFRIRCSKTNKDRGTFYSEYSPWKTVKITK